MTDPKKRRRVRCGNCGHALSVGERMCPSCGHVIPRSSKSGNGRPRPFRKGRKRDARIR